MQLRHVRLLVDDYPAAFRFWRDVVALPVVFGDENGGYADFETGGAILAVFDHRHMTDAVAVRETAASDNVVLVFGVGDVDERFAALRDAGAEVVAPPQDQPGWGIRVAHFRDPAGNLFEIYEPLPQR